MQRARLVVMAALAGPLLGSCSASGIASATADDAFTSCVESTGASLDGADDWDAVEQQAFWSEPGTLDCAIDELDDDARADALDEAFFDDDGDGAGGRRDQWDVIGTWAAATATTTSVDQTVDRAAPLLRALWVAEADDDTGANGLASVVVGSALYASGDLPSFDDYLATHPDASDDAAARVAYLVSIPGPTEEETSRYRALCADLIGQVRR